MSGSFLVGNKLRTTQCSASYVRGCNYLAASRVQDSRPCGAYPYYTLLRKRPSVKTANRILIPSCAWSHCNLQTGEKEVGFFFNPNAFNDAYGGDGGNCPRVSRIYN